MNLTNQSLQSLEHSTSFSKYFNTEDRYEEYNYSESNINETLLLEATHLDPKHDHSRPHLDPKISLLKQLKEDQGVLSREKSLVLDLCGDSSVQFSNEGSSKGEKSHQQIQDLYKICQKLVDTLSHLENKVVKMQQKDKGTKELDKDVSGSSLQKEAQSILTYSSLHSSKGCKCDSGYNQKDVISGLFQALHTRSTSQIYKEENEELKKKIIKLEIANEQMEKIARKAEGQNNRLRQLLRQYQNFNKRLIEERQVDEKQTTNGNRLSRNNSQHHLSERQFFGSKPNVQLQQLQSVKKKLPFDYYNFANHDEEKENMCRLEKPSKSGRQTPIEAGRSMLGLSGVEKNKINRANGLQMRSDSSFNEPKIIFEPQPGKSRTKKEPQPQSSIKITTFEQCKQREPRSYEYSSPFAMKKIDSKTSASDKHSQTFRELKEAKIKATRRVDY